MLRSRVLLSVLLVALSACGTDEEEPREPGNDESNNPPDNGPDHRPNVAGSYDVVGTMGIRLNGQTDIAPIRDVIRIDAGAPRRSTVHVHVASMSCGAGIRATMTGETAFTINEGTCPMPPENGCTSTVRINAGSGTRTQNGPLQLGLRGNLEVRCGSQSGSAELSIDVSGSLTGQSLPETRAQVHTARADDVGATLRRLTRELNP